MVRVWRGRKKKTTSRNADADAAQQRVAGRSAHAQSEHAPRAALKQAKQPRWRPQHTPRIGKEDIIVVLKPRETIDLKATLGPGQASAAIRSILGDAPHRPSSNERGDTKIAPAGSARVPSRAPLNRGTSLADRCGLPAASLSPLLLRRPVLREEPGATFPQTTASLLTVRFPALTEMEASPGSPKERMGSSVSPEVSHVSNRTRRLYIQLGTENTIHVCWPCKVSFKLPSKFIAHRLYKHGIHGTPRRHKVECPICHRKYKNQTIMTQHMGFHMGERQCFMCGAQFASLRSAIIHKRLHRNGGRFQCGFCREAFAHKGDQEEHLRLDHAQQQ
ncbi:uncharacterized protein LOC144115680 [Amblyomma americanum]